MSVQSKSEAAGSSGKPAATGGGAGGGHGAGESTHEDKHTQPRSTEELRAEIEQTRAEMGETVEALVAKADIPARVKHSAADKAAHLKETAADLKDATVHKAADLKSAVTGKAADLKETAAGKAAELKETAADKVAQVKGGSDADREAPGDAAGPGGPEAGIGERAAQIEEAAVTMGSQAQQVMTQTGSATAAGDQSSGPGHIAEATAQAGTRMASSAADAAERATSALDSARRRVASHPKEYALLGAALAAAAAGVALIRRSR
ncbi:uncharacterized protein DUF3618 [Actinoplanes teichomyceticus]|uniref:Uncharacterized protein DUF3618 n=2 Tax=Actinoplanes teichomyceticus TaxID=1867 RepID=A0A561WL29_ACTTI|nr:uncharacterized protein DUF3618 [Actinoplanes teichomyceticus]GIF14764.1 hypothetical protein Ate01nite_47960 [Actinoplanes teichomyceticus]